MLTVAVRKFVKCNRLRRRIAIVKGVPNLFVRNGMNGDSSRSDASKTDITSVVSAAFVSLDLCRPYPSRRSRELRASRSPDTSRRSSPEELVNRVCSIVEAIVLKRLVNLGGRRIQFGNNPPRFERSRRIRSIGIPPNAAIST